MHVVIIDLVSFYMHIKDIDYTKLKGKISFEGN